MNFPLCQIFSVLVMGISAPRCFAISEYGRGGEASIGGKYQRRGEERQIGAVTAGVGCPFWCGASCPWRANRIWAADLWSAGRILRVDRGSDRQPGPA